MKITYRKSVEGKYVNDEANIDSVEKLIDDIQNPPFPYTNPIQHFCKFSDKDLPLVTTWVQSNAVVPAYVFRGKKYMASIFRHKSPAQVEFWTARGWSTEEAAAKVSAFQSKSSKASWKREKESGKSRKTTTSIEFYKRKGMTEEEAALALKNRQATFSLEKCIKTYGEVEGVRRFKERQSKWISTLYNKTDEEVQSMIAKRLSSVFGKASTTSLSVFRPLVEKLKAEGIISDGEYYIGDGDSKEFMLYDKELRRVFAYDFTIPKLNLMIEYNGVTWHPNGEDWKPLPCTGLTTAECIEKEVRKKKLAEDNGFKVLYVWDNDDPQDAVRKCLEFVKTQRWGEGQFSGYGSACSPE